MSLLDMGVKFTYQVPSFSVLYVERRQVEIQVTADDGTVVMSDGFIRDDPLLNKRSLPALILLK